MYRATQLLTAATLLGATTAYNQRRYIDNSSGTPEVIIPGASSYNGLNLVPQMGWNTWNAFGCDADEELLLSSARHLVDFGLRDLGYNIISLDDCWSIGRNSSGYLVESPIKFPSGMASVISRLHDMGFKFGIYSSAGTFTCARYPGSLGYETQDAELWASWGVDYLKYDNCFNQGQSGTPKISYDRYNVMSQALNKTNREIIYAMCNWGNDDPYDWAYLIANSGRMSGDIYDSFNRPDDRCPCTEAPGCAWPGFHCSIMNILNKMPSITSRTMSGYFNDMDGLEVGNGGQDDNEYVTHFSMWAMNSSPLMIGTNIDTLSPQNLAILSNPAVIALNQDPSAGAAIRKWRYFVDFDDYGQGEISLWTRVLDNGDTVIALLNAGNSSRTMNATMDDIFLDQRTAGAYKAPPELSETWDVYDLWANRMSNEEAQAILDGGGNATVSNATRTETYNATATSYADGLSNNVTALYGAHIGSIAPSGTFTAEIARHSVGVYRLRSQGSGSLRKRDEL
ncbi:alpha-galactosidase [Paraphaeosphaeria sporulosa]|uniref:Alpha-galactosidase n=1 Tax=Paraphaeosphaeria sporulosa TaxID=1460663 RepID=A0A177BWQ6_9PLEO|nr:alpha-galactosidase [Paraphaeosphaeria sporulosa]OAF99565.1 alpha-galactosidase [Paraphaeosphaeria sporulosa]